jgi:hypothetical protein
MNYLRATKRGKLHRISRTDLDGQQWTKCGIKGTVVDVLHLAALGGQECSRCSKGKPVTLPRRVQTLPVEHRAWLERMTAQAPTQVRGVWIDEPVTA